MSTTVDPTVRLRTTEFHRVKAGNEDPEWEDCVEYNDNVDRGMARYAVLDGATEAFDVQRWVDQLAVSFVDGDAGRLSPAEMVAWMARMQQRWQESVPQFGSVFEELKFHEQGSFATLLALEISGLDGRNPRWQAVALGDTVLFHVRAERLLAHVPQLGLNDFGVHPDGVFTFPGRLQDMGEQLVSTSGELWPDDRLYVATDALAQCILRRCAASPPETVWREMAAMDAQVVFDQMVDDERACGRLPNDDVTLLRVTATRSAPDYLTVST